MRQGDVHWLTWAAGSLVLVAAIVTNTGQPFFRYADWGFPFRFWYWTEDKAAISSAIFGNGTTPELIIVFSSAALLADGGVMAAVVLGSMYAAHRCRWKPRFSFSLRSTLILVAGLSTVIAFVNQRIRSWEYMAVAVCEAITLAAVFAAWYAVFDISERLFIRGRKKASPSFISSR